MLTRLIILIILHNLRYRNNSFMSICPPGVNRVNKGVNFTIPTNISVNICAMNLIFVFGPSEHYLQNLHNKF